jgi:hypothetical protein
MALPAILTISYWTPKRGAILIGFVLTVLGSAGSQFFLDPPQSLSLKLDQQAKDVTADIDTLKNAQAQYLMFQQQGAMIYALNAGGIGVSQGNQKDILGNLYQLSLIDRASAIRTVIGQLAIAHLADFAGTSKSYGDLVDAARQDFSLPAYIAVEDFEKSMMTKAAAQMATLQQRLIDATQAKTQADALADERKLILLVLVTLGSMFLLLANLLSTKEDEGVAAKGAAKRDASVLELTTAQQIIELALQHAERLNDRPRP